MMLIIIQYDDEWLDISISTNNSTSMTSNNVENDTIPLSNGTTAGTEKSIN